MHNFKLFFPISISVQTICAIPSPEYVLSIRPLSSSSRQWNAILLFIGDQIFIDEYNVRFLQSYYCSIDFPQIFHIDKGFFAYFLFPNRTIVVFEKFFDLPIRWQASISLLDTFTSISSKFQLLSPKELMLNIIWNPNDFKVIPSPILL